MPEKPAQPHLKMKCAVCESCERMVNNPMCIFGGPYSGFGALSEEVTEPSAEFQFDNLKAFIKVGKSRN